MAIIYCPQCGAQTTPGAAFCKQCGASLRVADAQEPSAASAPASTPAVAPSTPGAAIVGTKPPSKLPLLVGLVGVIAAAALLYVFVIGPILRMRTVSLQVKCESLSSGSTHVPVRVSGREPNGTEVEQTLFLSTGKNEVSLPMGDYKVVVLASPVSAEGLLYEVPSSENFKVGENDSAESVKATFELEEKPLLDISDSDLEKAKEYALQDGGIDTKKANELVDAATAARDQAVEDQKTIMKKLSGTEWWVSKVSLKPGQGDRASSGFVWFNFYDETMCNLMHDAMDYTGLWTAEMDDDVIKGEIDFAALGNSFRGCDLATFTVENDVLTITTDIGTITYTPAKQQ